MLGFAVYSSSSESDGRGAERRDPDDGSILCVVWLLKEELDGVRRRNVDGLGRGWCEWVGFGEPKTYYRADVAYVGGCHLQYLRVRFDEPRNKRIVLSEPRDERVFFN